MNLRSSGALWPRRPAHAETHRWEHARCLLRLRGTEHRRGGFPASRFLILLVAIGLSFLLGHTTEAIAIMVIALFTVVLGFVQEHRAERALEALRRLSAPHATMLRDGEETEVPSHDLVPGDILLLEVGDIVPADARLLEAINLRLDEAALTGESSPVGKGVEALPEAEVTLGDRTNLVFSSTAVAAGRGRAVVIATGRHTEIGKISALLVTVTPAKTPFETHLERVGRGWQAPPSLSWCSSSRSGCCAVCP